jgi:hypothetical protein
MVISAARSLPNSKSGTATVRDHLRGHRILLADVVGSTDGCGHCRGHEHPCDLKNNAPMLMAFVVVLPLLGHATWHAYRESIDASLWPPTHDENYRAGVMQSDRRWTEYGRNRFQ